MAGRIVTDCCLVVPALKVISGMHNTLKCIEKYQVSKVLQSIVKECA